MIIFRKNALNSMSSAEELDRAIVIIKPVTWLIIFTILAFSAIFLLWSVMSRISTHVAAPGIFLPKDGIIVDVKAPNNATLERVYVNVGDIIESKGLVAQLSSQETERRLTYAKRKLKLEQGLYKNISSNISDRKNKRDKINQEQLERIDKEIELLKTEVRNNEEALKLQQKAFKRLDITRAQLASSRATYLQSKQRLNNLLSNREEKIYRELQLTQQDEVKLEKIRQNIQTLEDNVDDLNTSIKTSKITSPISGRVIEIKSIPGATVTANEVLLNVVSSQAGFYARAEKNIEFIAYVGVANGKNIDIGTETNVTVDGFNINDYGYVKGIVTKISSFPISSSGILSKLGNSRLVNYFTGNGPVYEVTVKLVQHTRSKNRLLWSTKKGMQIKSVDIGALGNAEFILKKTRPISKAIPAIKELIY